MLSVAVARPGNVELVDIPKPTPGPYEALIRTEVACLCNATDGKLVAGHFPGVEQYPLLLGHESVGIVDAVGEEVRNFKQGDRVVGGLLLNPTDSRYASGWGGFSEYTLAGDHQAMLADGVASSEHGWLEVFEIQRVVPPEVRAETAALLCVWREVYAGFSDFNLQRGDNILIFGAGAVGLSFTKFAKLLGLGFVGVVDLLPEKCAMALTQGADAVFAPGDAAIYELPNKLGKPLDAVIDAVGNENIINAALPLIKMAGSVCVYGVIDKPSIVIEKARGPYNFNLYLHQWPTRYRESAAQEPLCKWITEGKLRPDDFITDDFHVDEISEALEKAKSGSAVKVLLRF